MERLSDIIDQNPELNNVEEIGQIALPSVAGMFDLNQFVSALAPQVLIN